MPVQIFGLEFSKDGSADLGDELADQSINQLVVQVLNLHIYRFYGTPSSL